MTTNPPTGNNPTPPRCDGCGQPFPLISMSVYPHGIYCAPCDRARIAPSGDLTAERATVPSDIEATR